MKILFLAPFGIRPKGTVLARMIPIASELQSLGHEVVIVAPPYTNPEDSGKTDLVRGVRLVNVVLGPKQKALAAPLLAWRMFRAAYREKPDLVHLFKPKGYGGLAAMLHLALRGAGLRLPPLLLDSDDWEGTGGMNELHDYSYLERRLYRFQEQSIPRHAAGVTVASRALETMVLEMGIPRQNVLYLPNCAGEPRPGDGAALRATMSLPPEVPVVLLYTRFFEFKQEKLHHVLAEIYRQRPRVRFLVVGKGPRGEEERLAAVARERGFSQALLMAGWVEPALLPDYLAAADLALYPFSDTLVNRTKCPAKLTEILLAGRAVVTDQIGQIPEYLAAGEAGILCDPDDWDEMVHQALGLIDDPLRLRALGEAGRLHLLDRFRWGDFVGRLERFYLQCCAPPRPGTSVD